MARPTAGPPTLAATTARATAEPPTLAATTARATAEPPTLAAVTARATAAPPTRAAVEASRRGVPTPSRGTPTRACGRALSPRDARHAGALGVRAIGGSAAGNAS